MMIMHLKESYSKWKDVGEKSLFADLASGSLKN